MKSIEEFTDGRFKSIPIIGGPTASGKSLLSLSLCLEIQGELCSMDSMQIYRHMDIGTAKPSLDDQKAVPHHLIDQVEPNENYSAALYKEAALSCIDLCLERGTLPVFCGGTGQYASALSQGISYNPISIDSAVHDALQKEASEKGYEYLYNELIHIDPESASKIHPNNTKRLLRAIEIFRQTGKTMTYFNKISKIDGPQYPFSIFAIHLDREILYRRIDLRVDQMLENGLLDEVAGLKKRGLTSAHTSMQAIGYKELLGYLEGYHSFEDAVSLIKQKSKNYGKRQMTWFRNMGGVTWIEPGNIEAILKIIKTDK